MEFKLSEKLNLSDRKGGTVVRWVRRRDREGDVKGVGDVGWCRPSL